MTSMAVPLPIGNTHRMPAALAEEKSVSRDPVSGRFSISGGLYQIAVRGFGRIPRDAGQVARLFADWREELATCRRFVPAACNYAAAGLMADAGLRVNEARCLDLAAVKSELGRFGKLHVRRACVPRNSARLERRSWG